MSSASFRLTPSLPHIKKAVADWNSKPGEVWGVKASVDESKLQTTFAIADEVFAVGGPFPERPGPFKLLALFCLSVQYASPFVWENSRSGHFGQELRHWEPRLTIWALPYISELVTLNDVPVAVPLTFPTPHLQLEAVNYLRIIHQSHQGAAAIDRNHLIEQVLLYGLCLESSAYASFPNTARLEPVMKCAEKCIYKNDDPRWPDQHFMDEVFFEQYFEAGMINVD